MSSLPSDLKERLKQQLWDQADQMDWLSLTDRDRSDMYERWAVNRDIGTVLARYMDARQVRVYIKDSLMKAYIRGRMEASESLVYEVLGINKDAGVLRTFIKPHGKHLSDGRVLCWGSVRDWKLLLMSVYERSFVDKAVPFAAVFIDRKGIALEHWPMIAEAATRLRIERVELVDAR